MASPRHVVIVEDDADNRELLVLFLEQSGLCVACYASAEAALAGMVDVPALVVTDVSLSGGMSGVAFARALKERPAFAALPVYAITGHAPETLGEGRALFARVFTKPVDPSALASAAAQVVGAREP